MGKTFAVVLIIITLVSTAVFIFHDFNGMSLWLPVDASAHGHGVDHQLMETMYGSGFLFVLSQVLLGLFVWQASNRKEGWKYKTFPGGAKPMVLLPILLVGIEILALSFVGSKVWAGIYLTPAESQALPIDVQAGQFAFYFRYAGADGKFGAIHADKIDEGSGNFFGLDPRNDEAARDDIVVASMVIPVNRPISLTLHSKDVIHSFYVRELRIQQDMVPGLMIPLHFTATKTGRYEIVCTQLCGLGHYQMKAYLEVKTQDEFDQWLKQQEAAQ
jgi:cytochrome c oxidase subunit 2